MRLIRLALTNWRGVRSRDIAFDKGVTIVEGPNEIGKSTIVDALRALVRFPDSSKDRQIKAIQPVGEDVGSRVEAEMRAGSYHFVYSKTFNKHRQTRLEVLAPDKRQLAGREAHDAVGQMLAETVDMGFFEALLVDQGEKVGPAKLHESAVLAQALDEAAGSAGEAADADGAENASLIEAVRAEYEKYFTLKTGRSRITALETAQTEATDALERARAALAQVQHDADRQESRSAEARRLRTALPELEARLEALRAARNATRDLENQLETNASELTAARSSQADTARMVKGREQLAADLAASRRRLAELSTAQAPLERKHQAQTQQIADAVSVVTALQSEEKTARQRLGRARSDLTLIGELDRLADARNRLTTLDAIAADLKTHLEVIAAVKVDDEAVRAYRVATESLIVAMSKRDAAATTITVTAETDITVAFDGERIEMGKSDSRERAVSRELRLRLPDIVDISVTPSHDVAELAQETADAQAALCALAKRYEAKSLDDAVAANEVRAAAQRQIDELRSREEAVLAAENRQQIEQRVLAFKENCDRLARQREADDEPPQTAAEARSRLSAAEARHEEAHAALEQARDRVQALNVAHEGTDRDQRDAQQALAGAEAEAKAVTATLQRARSDMTDEDLAARARQQDKAVARLDQAARELKGKLEQAAPEAAVALLENARAVHAGTQVDLSAVETDLAVLADRLGQAQANGRYEAFESAERADIDTRAELDTTRRRADAARLLWTTLNKHRDCARAAYVLPLKRAIERLGVIVFGGDFEIALADDWSIASRTLDGKTLAYDSLSVGAREQLSILTRLAAATIVSTQGGVPLIIDDALGFSDPGRLETMGAAIAAAGKQTQVIILTCSPGRFMHVGNARTVRFSFD